MRDGDSEIVRKGRNQPFVRQNHFYQDIITKEQHTDWYARVSQSRDYYLVAYKDEVPLGLLYLKDISPGMLTGQIGVFFWQENILRTRIPILSIIIFLDFFLTTVGVDRIDALIRMDNRSMDNIVKFLNFDITYDSEQNTINAHLTRQRFLTHRNELIKYAQRLCNIPKSWMLHVEGDVDARHHPEILQIITQSQS